jgi:hypothetical protein
MKREPIWVNLDQAVVEKSQSILSIFGVIIIILVGIDYLVYLIPFQLTNPNWQFDFIGKVANLTWAPLLGLVCIFFYQSQQPIKRSKLYFLRLVSWLALLVGILHLALLPLLIQNAYRIHNNNQATLSRQVQQRVEQLNQFEIRIETVTDDELSNFIANLTRQGQVPQIDNPQELKEQILTRVQQSEQQIRSEAETLGKNQARQLAKNAISWALIIIISSFAFIWIWYLTGWTRNKQFFSEIKKAPELEVETWEDQQQA